MLVGGDPGQRAHLRGILDGVLDPDWVLDLQCDQPIVDGDITVVVLVCAADRTPHELAAARDLASQRFPDARIIVIDDVESQDPAGFPGRLLSEIGSGLRGSPLRLVLREST